MPNERKPHRRAPPVPPARPGDPRAESAEAARVFRRRRVVALLLAAVMVVLGARALAGGAGVAPPFDRAGGDEPAPAGNEGREPVRLTVAATGDFLIHSPVFERALANGGGRRYDFRPMFEDVKAYIEGADLAICHVETPMTDAPPTGFPVFNTPPSLARAIAATGWDVCSTASNHTLDQGQDGIEQTNRALDRAGIAHAGSYTSRTESDEPTIVEVGGVEIAFLAYTEMTNGIPLPEPWSVDLAEAPRILDDARAARERGAEVVIVNLHAGEEFQHEPSTSQRRLARRLTGSDDVTALIGQHVHVVQPIEEVNGKLVVFGEGNLVSNQTAACCPAASQDGLIALLDLVVGPQGARVERVRYVPVYVRHPDFTVLPVGDAIEAGDGDVGELRASYQRTVDVVGRGNRFGPEPVRLP